MINDPVKLSFREGFVAGLEAAADYHQDRVFQWRSCIAETHNPIDQSVMMPNIKNHIQYARDIMNLKERSTLDEQENTQKARTKAETSQELSADSENRGPEEGG